ncbi:hypothetical protein LFML04_0761 [Leptospirillum ferriphilum ML-04]|uniref:Uncharacterized protein n=1 Tax=Leptospirillum ferriphilum (strain ML-04) TaxID=1048260 RepID=J9Z907_LEPFM|nr:hypothetical protein LFML04_0761 [Leptospirillum ferriphilum ML-04]
MELLDLPARKHMKRLDARQSDTRRHPGKKKAGRTLRLITLSFRKVRQ